jgi:hypothetical protein
MVYGELLGLSETTKPAQLASRGGCWFESSSVKIHLGIDPNFTPARNAHSALLIDDSEGLCLRLREAGYDTAPDQQLEGLLGRIHASTTLPWIFGPISVSLFGQAMR